MPRCAVQVQVHHQGDLLLWRLLPPARDLTVGPDPGAAIPTSLMPNNTPVLVWCRGGYGLRLPPGLTGEVRVGGRTLAFENGLIRDPRPEPLLLVDGDSGVLQLEGDLELRFMVCGLTRRFAPIPRIDRGLALSLGATALVFALALLVVAPWRDTSPTNKPQNQEPKLTRRSPAVLRLAKVTPPTKPAPAAVQRTAGARSTPQRTGAPRRTRRATARRATANKNAGVLDLARGRGKRPPSALKRLLGAGDTDLTRSALRSLERLDSNLIGTTLGALGSHGPGGRGGGAGGGGDHLAALLDPGAGGPRGGADGSTVRLNRMAPIAPPRLSRPSPGPARRPSREEIREVVTQGSAPIRLCYEREILGSAAPVEGRLLLRWTIDPSGRVAKLTVVKDTVGSHSLAQCVLTRVRKWRFPPCTQECVVVYPFDFYPQVS
jgi:TonB family protein